MRSLGGVGAVAVVGCCCCCCCCCCCWNSSEQFRELGHGEPERRQLAARRTKPVPRQEVTPGFLHQRHFRALWTSFLRLGSWRGVRRKKLVHGVRVKRRIAQFRAASISRCIRTKLLMLSLFIYQRSLYFKSLEGHKMDVFSLQMIMETSSVDLVSSCCVLWLLPND